MLGILVQMQVFRPLQQVMCWGKVLTQQGLFQFHYPLQRVFVQILFLILFTFIQKQLLRLISQLTLHALV